MIKKADQLFQQYARAQMQADNLVRKVVRVVPKERTPLDLHPSK